jgi:hypothetical protein
MTTRSWNGGTARFGAPDSWTPPGSPASGDTLFVGSGTAHAAWTVLSGLNVFLQTAPGAPAPSGSPTLRLDEVVIGPDTRITLGGTQSSGMNTATIVGGGVNWNRGTVDATAFVGLGPNGTASTLTVQVPWLLVNTGTLEATPGAFAPLSTLVLTGGHTGLVLNQGLVETDGIVRLDLDVLGLGTLGLGPTISESTLGPLAGPTLEAVDDVGTGQTVDFAWGGSDSHGTLMLDEPSTFHALIANFIASTDNVSALHTDQIALPGLNVTAFDYAGSGAGGVLTLQAGGQTVAQLRFAGSYTTSSFEVVHPTATSSIIEVGG